MLPTHCSLPVKDEGPHKTTLPQTPYPILCTPESELYHLRSILWSSPTVFDFGLEPKTKMVQIHEAVTFCQQGTVLLRQSSQ